MPLKTGGKFRVGCSAGGQVFMVIFSSLAIFVETGSLQMPADSIATICLFESKAVTERYVATTSCSCSAYSGPTSCVNNIAQLEQLDPVTCRAGSGPCPDNTNSTCGGGYACCSLRCESDESPDCFCDSSVSNQTCVVVPYLIYFATFRGGIVRFDSESNGDTVNQFVIDEPYNTSYSPAVVRVSEVPLFTITPCYYDPYNIESVTFAPYNQNEKYFAVFLSVGLLMFMILCLCGFCVGDESKKC